MKEQRKYLEDLWADELIKDYPDVFKDPKDPENFDNHNLHSALTTMDEYWDVYFDPYMMKAEILAECGWTENYRSPEFVEKARLIAEKYHYKHLMNLKKIVMNLINEMAAQDIIADSLIIPYFIVNNCGCGSSIKWGGGYRKINDPFKHIYGVKFTTTKEDIVRLESSQCGRFLEIEYNKQ